MSSRRCLPTSRSADTLLLLLLRPRCWRRAGAQHFLGNWRSTAFKGSSHFYFVLLLWLLYHWASAVVWSMYLRPSFCEMNRIRCCTPLQGSWMSDSDSRPRVAAAAAAEAFKAGLTHPACCFAVAASAAGGSDRFCTSASYKVLQTKR